jgi:DNA-binding MarR family transcriptional regulator
VAKPKDTKAVLLASRALVAIAAKSLAQVEDLVTAMQWRVMVVVSRQGELALHELATALGVHPSTGTRLCDQLVAKGLLTRHDHPADRRYLVLSLTPAGKGLVDRVTQERQRDIGVILDRLLPATRKQLVKALSDFAEAAGELTVDPQWDLVQSPAGTSGG